MAFNNPLVQNVLSGLDDPESEFGAGFDIGMKTDASAPNIALEEQKKQEEADKQRAKKGKRARALEAIANALVVYSSKDPAKAAQAMIEMRMQMINQEKNRIAEDVRLEKQLTARQEEGALDRGSRREEVEMGIESREKLAEGQIAATAELQEDQQTHDLNKMTEVQRLQRENDLQQQVDQYAPGTDPSLAQMYVTCKNTPGCTFNDNPALERINGQVAAGILKDNQARTQGTAAQLAQIDIAKSGERARMYELFLTTPSAMGPPTIDSPNGVPVYRTPEEASAAVNAYYGQPTDAAQAADTGTTLTKEATELQTLRDGFVTAAETGDLTTAVQLGGQLAAQVPGADDSFIINEMFEYGVKPADLAKTLGEQQTSKGGKERAAEAVYTEWYSRQIDQFNANADPGADPMDFFVARNVAAGMSRLEAGRRAGMAYTYMVEESDRIAREQAKAAERARQEAMPQATPRIIP